MQKSVYKWEWRKGRKQVYKLFFETFIAHFDYWGLF